MQPASENSPQLESNELKSEVGDQVQPPVTEFDSTIKDQTTESVSFDIPLATSRHPPTEKEEANRDQSSDLQANASPMPPVEYNDDNLPEVKKEELECAIVENDDGGGNDEKLEIPLSCDSDVVTNTRTESESHQSSFKADVEDNIFSKIDMNRSMEEIIKEIPGIPSFKYLLENKLISGRFVRLSFRSFHMNSTKWAHHRCGSKIILEVHLYLYLTHSRVQTSIPNCFLDMPSPSPKFGYHEIHIHVMHSQNPISADGLEHYAKSP